MASPDERPRSTTLVAGVVATIVLLGGALAVRGLEGAAPLAPEDRPRAPDAVREPMQLLGRAAALRIAELDERVDAARSEEWKTARRIVFELQDCPTTAEWLDSAEGQRVERVLGELRRGSSSEALAALALAVEIARRTEWDPGLLARTASADRLASLLQEWLRAWGQRGADDATLAEPASAAALLYGRAMRRVARPLPITSDDAAYERAKSFLSGLLTDPQGQPTALSRALRARHPSAVERFGSKQDCLAGFDDEAEQEFPGLDGECE